MAGAAVIDKMLKVLYDVSGYGTVSIPDIHVLEVTQMEHHFLKQLEDTPGWFDQAFLSRWNELYGHMRPIPAKRPQFRLSVVQHTHAPSRRRFYETTPQKFNTVDLPGTRFSSENSVTSKKLRECPLCWCLVDDRDEAEIGHREWHSRNIGDGR